MRRRYRRPKDETPEALGLKCEECGFICFMECMPQRSLADVTEVVAALAEVIGPASEAFGFPDQMAKNAITFIESFQAKSDSAAD